MSGKITALKVQKRNSQRVNVYLDDEYAFGLARITAAWLQVGQELSDAKIDQLQSDDARETAYQRALGLLDRRPRSEQEIRRYLVKHDIEEEVVNDVLQRLSHSGLVNDKDFASLWVENRQSFRPRSRKALAFEMRQKGIASDAIDQVLGEISDQDEEDLAYQAASQQARKYKNMDWLGFRQKLSGFLARRGFDYETSRAAIQRAWQDLTVEDTGTGSTSFSHKNLKNERHQDDRR